MAMWMRENIIGEHFFFYFNAENVFICVSSLFSDKISTSWMHEVHAVWFHMDELESFCWHRVIRSPMLRDLHTILKLTVLQMNYVLVHYDPKKELIFTCNASQYNVGAVLSHIMPNGSKKPVTYASWTLLSAKKNYSQLDKEGLGIIFGVKNSTSTCLDGLSELLWIRSHLSVFSG